MSPKPLARPDVAKLLLRLSVGGLMLFHGVHKLQHGVGSIRAMLAERGLPEWLAQFTHLGEFVAPLLIVLGFFTRPAALIVAFTMLASVYLAYGAGAFGLNDHGGFEIELNLLYLCGALALFFGGGGRYGARRGEGAWD